MRGIAMCVLVGLPAACTDRHPTHIVPLAELDAEIVIDTSRNIHLRPFTEGQVCHVLSPERTVARLDGTPGELDPGGGGHYLHDFTCDNPTFEWDSYNPDVDPSTIEITDGSATWRLVVWDPWVGSRFELVSHPEPMPIRPGDTVTLRLAVAHGTIANAKVSARDGATMLFALDEASGLTRTGLELSFVMPAVTQTTASLSVTADYQFRIDHCDAPRGCNRARTTGGSFTLAIEQPPAPP